MHKMSKTLHGGTNKIERIEQNLCGVSCNRVRIEGFEQDCVPRHFIRFHTVALHHTLR